MLRRLQQILFGVAFVWSTAPLAGAQVTTVAGASVLVFPRVVVDGTWDTTIQIGNSANRPTFAHCFYVNGALSDPAAPPGPANPPVWAQIDFPIVLPAHQQPTHW